MRSSRLRIFHMQRMLLQQEIKMTILYLPSATVSAVAMNMDDLQYAGTSDAGIEIDKSHRSVCTSHNAMGSFS